MLSSRLLAEDEKRKEKKKTRTSRKRRAGVILAGGESRRFGTPKAFAQYDGSYFYEQAIKAVAPYVEDLILVSHPTLTNRFKNQSLFHVVEDVDDYKGKGPLAGIYTAMNQVKADWYVIMPCDMPLIDKEMISKLLSNVDASFDAIVPSVAGKIQPLCALYQQTSLPYLEQQLKKREYRMMDFLQMIKVKWLTEEEVGGAVHCFQNINTADAYAQLVHEKPFDKGNSGRLSKAPERRDK